MVPNPTRLIKLYLKLKALAQKKTTVEQYNKRFGYSVIG